MKLVFIDKTLTVVRGISKLTKVDGSLSVVLRSIFMRSVNSKFYYRV